jgi:hypothetical protein
VACPNSKEDSQGVACPNSKEDSQGVACPNSKEDSQGVACPNSKEVPQEDHRPDRRRATRGSQATSQTDRVDISNNNNSHLPEGRS